MAFYEHHKRSIAKSVTFRIIVLLADFLVVFFFTHRVEVTIGLVLATNLSSTVLYYFHERAWNEIHWGKKIQNVK